MFCFRYVGLLHHLDAAVLDVICFNFGFYEFVGWCFHASLRVQNAVLSFKWMFFVISRYQTLKYDFII